MLHLLYCSEKEVHENVEKLAKDGYQAIQKYEEVELAAHQLDHNIEEVAMG